MSGFQWQSNQWQAFRTTNEMREAMQSLRESMQDMKLSLNESFPARDDWYDRYRADFPYQAPRHSNHWHVSGVDFPSPSAPNTPINTQPERTDEDRVVLNTRRGQGKELLDLMTTAYRRLTRRDDEIPKTPTKEELRERTEDELEREYEV